MKAFSRCAGDTERYRLSNSVSVRFPIRVGEAVSAMFTSYCHSIAGPKSEARQIRRGVQARGVRVFAASETGGPAWKPGHLGALLCLGNQAKQPMFLDGAFVRHSNNRSIKF